MIRKVIDYAQSISFRVLHLEFSPIKGPEGNIEYLLHLVKFPGEEDTQRQVTAEIKEIVEKAHGTLD